MEEFSRENEDNSLQCRNKVDVWKNRRCRLAVRRYGGIKSDYEELIPKPNIGQVLKNELITIRHKNERDTLDGDSIVLRNLRSADLVSGVRSRSSNDETEDYRPYFTYWISFVQILILIISISLYGIGNFNFFVSENTGLVLTKSLTLEQIRVKEPGNFWLGPRPADLIHLGAKFTPCMRKDEFIHDMIERDKSDENEYSGCCVRNDHSGCVQTTVSSCSPLLSNFIKWSSNGENGPDNRTAGPVCGLDPRFCSLSHDWKDDLRAWPPCYPSNQETLGWPSHMTCELIARPCCIGIHGKCEIQTKELCDWVKGTFHSEANLCSQVSCMEDICGMLPFFHFNVPDQIYRLISSLFLHAGLFHVTITLFVQLYYMRDLEKLLGPLRLSVLYLISGVAGNLASAVFTPYRAEVGPAGSLFALLGTHVIEVLHAWKSLHRPHLTLSKLMCVSLTLFLSGFLPWVDNYAHIFGFLFGLMLSWILVPPPPSSPYLSNSVTRLSSIILLSCLSFGTFLSLLLVFYFAPLYDCEWCSILSCIPFTKDFCAVHHPNLGKNSTL